MSAQAEPTIRHAAEVGEQIASRRMSYDEFMAWTHEGGLAEWVDGEVVLLMTARDEHQRVVEFLDRILGLFAQIFQLGLVRIAPFAMRAVPDGPVREPDLLFLAAEHLDRRSSTKLDGPADLVVEVVSNDSVARDRADKFYEYQSARIPEYWILDPRPGLERADFYVLDDTGVYQPIPIGTDGIYRSAVLPDFWFKVAWLWSPDADPLAALVEIVGFDRLVEAMRGSSGLR